MIKRQELIGIFFSQKVEYFSPILQKHSDTLPLKNQLSYIDRKKTTPTMPEYDVYVWHIARNGNECISGGRRTIDKAPEDAYNYFFHQAYTKIANVRKVECKEVKNEGYASIIAHPEHIKLFQAGGRVLKMKRVKNGEIQTPGLVEVMEDMYLHLVTNDRAYAADLGGCPHGYELITAPYLDRAFVRYFLDVYTVEYSQYEVIKYFKLLTERPGGVIVLPDPERKSLNPNFSHLLPDYNKNRR